MRTPNTECIICGKPLYRRPSELKKVRYVACMEHRNEAQKRAGLTGAQLAALASGRLRGTNHLEGIPKSAESNRKRASSIKAWCEANPDKVKARGKKTRGPNHYNWKGGSSRLNTAIRGLTENRRWMDAVVRRDGKCLHCGADTDLEAHHIKSLVEIIAEYGITTLEQARQCAALWDLSNGTTLCEQCHCEHHGRAYTSTGNGRRKAPRKARRTMAGEANPNYRGGKVSLTCPQCGAVFQVKQSEVGKRRYCSRECVNEHQRKAI